MHDAAVVRVLECVGDLAGELKRLIEGNRTAGNALRQRRPLDQLHYQRADVACVLDAVQHGDVRMIHRGQHAGLALEARHAFGVAGEGRGQDFERDVAVELGVAGAVDFAHSAGAQFRADLIVRQFTANRHA